MGKPINLHSADGGISRVRLYPENIEAYFEYDSSKDQSEFEKLYEALQDDLIKWGKEVHKFLSKSKSAQALKLIEDYKEIYENFIDDVGEEESSIESYRIIKMHSGTFYTVTESIEKIDDLIEENEKYERYGFSD